MAVSKPDYRVTQAINRILDTFYEERKEDLFKAIEEVEERDGPSVDLTNRRLDLVRRLEDPVRELAALRTAVESHPDEAALRKRLKRYLDGRGYQYEAIEVQQKLVELEPKKKEHRKRLSQDWRRLRNPVAALAALEEKEEEKDDVEKAERTPPATVQAIKKSLEAGDRDDTRVLFRRLWRVFPDRSNQYFRWDFDHRSSLRHVWPRDRKKADKPYRGGLPEFPDPDEKKKEKDANEPRPAHLVLAEEDFGEGEIRRHLRSLSPAQLNSIVANDCYRALSNLAVERVGRESAVRALLDTESMGAAGKREYGLLFALLEEIPADSGLDPRSMLSGLMKNLDPKDSAQLRRLARLYARTGDSQRAARLYRWCAVAQEGDGFSYYRGASDLLDEVIENLDGEERDRCVQAVLDFGDPGEEAFWGRDQYERMVLDTWIKLIGPEAALGRSRPLLEKVNQLANQPKRRAAQLAAYLHARAGEHEAAVSCLETALCTFEAPDDLKYPWYRTYFENPGFIGTRELGLLFPRKTTGWKDPAGWLDLAAGKIDEWAQGDRLRDHSAFQLQALMALRLHQSDRPERSQVALARAESLAGEHAGRALWIADVARLTGGESRADAIERDLLDKRRLQIERVPEVVERVRKAEGDGAAITLGESAAEFTLHPDLLDLIVEAANAEGLTEKSELWSAKKEESESAEKALEKSS